MRENLQNPCRLVNIAFFISIGVPILFIILVLRNKLSQSSAFFLSTLTLALIPTVCGLYFAKILKNSHVLCQKISPLKNNAINEAQKYCFRNILFSPRGKLAFISEFAWNVSTKKHGVTVKAALVASPNIDYIALGVLFFLGSYSAFFCEFGIVSERILKLFGDQLFRFFLVSLSSYSSSVYLFHGTVRLSLKGDEK